MTKPVIVKGKSVTGQLIIRHLKKGDSFSMMFEYYEDGRRVQKMEKTGLLVEGNVREAKKMLVARVQELDQQLEQQRTALPGSDMRFSDWVRQWLEGRKKRMDAITHEGYRVNAENHILPYFDKQGTTLAELTCSILQDFIDHKEEKGRKNGKGGLSPKSLRHLKSIMNLALQAAKKKNLIRTNPCAGLELPEMVRLDYKVFNEQELKRLFESLRDEYLYPLIITTLVYGLRREETLGLQWDSVDFANNMITIKRVRTKMGTVYVEKEKMKTKLSYRSFPLLPDIREMLLELKERERENRRLFGREYDSNAFVFKWDNGKPYAPDFVTQKFPKLLKRYDLPHIRLHDLRHSCCSLLLMWGFSLKDVSDWLGHSNISITADVYGHLDMSRKLEIADRVSEQLLQRVQGITAGTVSKSVSMG